MGSDEAPVTPATPATARNRLHVESPFKRESLMNRAVISGTAIEHELPIFEDAHLIHLGGMSIIDQGARVLLPLIEAIVEARRDHKIIVGVGGGARERHTYAQAVDLGLPTGALAQLTGVMCKQNATMVFYLLAQHGGVRVAREDFPKIPFYLDEGGIPVIVDMASYHFWEYLPQAGRIPPHRPDCGAFLLSEVYSCRSCTFLKDVDGIYSADPKKNPEATLIPEITVSELKALELPDLCLESTLLDILESAKNQKSVRVINGHRPEQLARALAGESVGTLLRQT